MRDIEIAIIGNIELSFKYRSEGAKALPRQVRPIGVVYNRFAYLIAATGNREAVSYRMDMLWTSRSLMSPLLQKKVSILRIG